MEVSSDKIKKLEGLTALKKCDIASNSGSDDSSDSEENLIDIDYEVTPLHADFGGIVSGVDLNEAYDFSDELIEKLVIDVYRYKVLFFRNQGKMAPEMQLYVSQWFGEVESTFYKHPASPHPDIFRVSNDEEVGCTNVGRSGWHIDGTFLKKPFKVQTMHFWSVSEHGSTLITPLKNALELLQKKDPEMRAYLDTLYFMSNDYFTPPFPLFCKHPLTGEETMAFHLGLHFLKEFHVNYDA